MSSTIWQAVGHPVEDGWVNWSGSLRFRPARVEEPGSEQALAALVADAAGQNRTVRPVGSAHSSTPIFATDDTLVRLRSFSGLLSHDPETQRARLGAGSILQDLGQPLQAAGLAMPNFGDVATQTVAGALLTGTHGSGRSLCNLSMMLVGGRMVTGTGAIRSFSFETDADLVRALRVSLGTLGVLTEAEVRIERYYELVRQEWCSRFDACIDRMDAISQENRNFDFYWYPRSDEVKLRCLSWPGQAHDYSGFARLEEEQAGPPHDVIPKHSGIKHRFEEMEYALPVEAGLDCLREVRQRLKEKWRRTVGWRVLFRYVRADDTWLSEAHGRDTATISIHQNASLPFRDFFADLEPVFRHYGGRPHWAKKHTLRAKELRPLYPKWDDFLALRRDLDPRGVFLTPYLRELFGVEAGG